MKKLFLILAVGFGSILSAGGGYVCYDSRTIVNMGGDDYYMKYDGCIISRYSCRSMGMKRFGYYGDRYATREALRRCLRSKPRFVD